MKAQGGQAPPTGTPPQNPLVGPTLVGDGGPAKLGHADEEGGR